jgi:two-component system KDP operon response regulator KdpE
MPSTVLVIDDDTAAIQMLKETLESYSFKVITAQIVQEGIEVARECKPDVIVIDLFMTGLSGEQICRAIREFTRVPILVLSAMTKPGAVAQALNEGADDYLIKPVSAGVLVAHLNNLIRRAHGENGAQAVSVNPL